MKIWISVFSSSTEELPCYTMEYNMQGCLEFPILVDLTHLSIWPKWRSVIKSRDHGIWFPKTNVNKCNIIIYFIRGMYKELNITIILMMKEKEKLHPITIYYVKIINSPKPKKSN